MSGSTCDWPGNGLDGTCGKWATHLLTTDGKKRPLCPHHATGVAFGDLQLITHAGWNHPRDPAPSIVDPVIDVMPVSESVRPEPFPDEEPAEVRLKNAVIDLALAGCETLLDRLKAWRKR